MKKFISTLLIAISLFTLAPKKEAKAGFMVVAALQEYVWHHRNRNLDTVLVIGLSVTMVATGTFLVFNGFGYALISGALLLDQDLEKEIGQVKGNLIGRYPFINDDLVIDNLAETIVTKYENASDEEKDEHGSMMIKLNEEEILKAVEPADLTDEEVDKLLETLK